MTLTFTPVAGIGEVRAGDDLAALIASARPDLISGDVLVVAQKIVSKAEGRAICLDDVQPGARAVEIAATCGKDARLVELVLRESSEVLRVAPGVLIVRHRLGFVVANAGIDQSNVPGSDRHALLLPHDPDASAARLRAALGVAVLISDSFGRAWRFGVTGACIGCAGLSSLADLRGEPDREGRKLEVTQVAIADQICAAATLVMGEAAEGQPAVIVRGVPARFLQDSRPAADLVRPLKDDLFR